MRGPAAYAARPCGPLPRAGPAAVSRPGEAGQRLDRLLEAWLVRGPRPAVSRCGRAHAGDGGCRPVDGRPWRRPGAVLRRGAAVVARVDPARLGPPAGEREVAQAFGAEPVPVPGRVGAGGGQARRPADARDRGRRRARTSTTWWARPPPGGRRRAVSRAPPAARPRHVRRRAVHARPRRRTRPLAGRCDRRAAWRRRITRFAPARASACRGLARRGSPRPGGPVARTAFAVLRPLGQALLVEARPDGPQAPDPHPARGPRRAHPGGRAVRRRAGAPPAG